MDSKQINNKVKKIGKLMSLESKLNIVGSAKIKKNLWYSDYDLFENVKGKSERLIYNHFRGLFEIIKNSSNSVITDFKCGSDGNNPLRWDYFNLMRNNNNGFTFEEALRHKGLIKLDVIIYLNGRFIEISHVYNIYLNGKPNMNYSQSEVIKELTDDYKEFVLDGNYMKSLKRMYSIIKKQNPNDKTLDILINYFNSPIGLLYRCKSDLQTLELVLFYNKFTLDQVIDSLQMLKEIISAFSVENNLEQISKLKNKDEMKRQLKKQIKVLSDYINRDAKKFLQTSQI